MARDTFNVMVTEATLRLGNHDYTGFSARVQRWLSAAYYHCATTWHHPELDGVDESRVLQSSRAEVRLPDDVKVPISVALLQPGTSILDRYLKPRDFHLIQAQFDETEGKPSLVARYGQSLYFERKSDADYPVRIYYYETPPPPTFDATPVEGSGTSALAEEWDEILLEMAVYLGYQSLWRPDLAAIQVQTLNRLLQGVTNRPLADDMLADRTTQSKRDTTLMGALG